VETPHPLVSVITVCWNSGKTIKNTIESVLNQTYPHIQYIIVDGGSTDETLNIINNYRNRIAALVSEKDDGISDAFNKGLRLATGKYVQILNSDDRLDLHKIERSVNLLENNTDFGFVFGDVTKEREGGVFERIAGNKDYVKAIHYTMPKLNHPTVLARKELYDRYGGFEKQWKLAMDYDWLLRIHLAGVRGFYSDSLIVHMNAGGLSDAHAYGSFREVKNISIKHGFNKLGAFLYYYMRCVKHFMLLRLGIRR
jgi:glycosyltransferase involved in cell wall biosynthesis